jgi:hypothetical protein
MLPQGITVNPFALILILFAQLDVDSLTKAVTDIGARLSKLERLLPKDEPDKLTPIPPGDGLQLLDSRGVALTEVKDGRQFRIVASAAGKWSFKTSAPDDDYDVTELPTQLICTLRNGAKLFVAHVTETGSDLTTIIVQCGNGPRPPPKPVDPVEPDDKPISTHKVGGVYLVWEPSTVTPEQSSVIADLGYWTKLRASGVTTYTYLPTTADELGKWTLEQMRAKGIPPPAIVLVDKGRFLLDVVALPKSVQAVDAVIAKAGGR